MTSSWCTRGCTIFSFTVCISDLYSCISMCQQIQGKQWRRFRYECADDRIIFLILNNVFPWSYTSPPLPPTLGESSVRFRMPKCEHLHQGTTNSFILPQRTLPWQQMLVMSQPPDGLFLKAVACLGVWEVNISSPHMFKTANPPGPSPRCYPCCQEVETCKLTIMKLQLFHSFQH